LKDTTLTKAAEELVAFEMKAIDRLIEELVEPLRLVGNPEDVMGLPIEQWTPDDYRKAITIYGTKEPNPLSNLIFKKKLEQVKGLEAEVV
jgi:hypothetical protein